MPINNFLGVLTHQLAIITTSTFYMWMAVCMIIVNVTDWSIYNKLGYPLAMGTAFFMFVTWFIAFVGALKKYDKLLMVAIILWTTFLIIWSALVMLNFINDYGLYCVNRRCSETMWLMYSPYNGFPMDNPFDYYYHEPHVPPPNKPYRFVQGGINPEESYLNNSRSKGSHSTRKVHMNIKHMTEILLHIIFGKLLLLVFVISWKCLIKCYNDIKCFRECVCPEICNDFGATNQNTP